jgi:hypothetical protein
MCHLALASDQEELAWLLGKDSLREKQEHWYVECISGSLLGLAEGPGKQQFERLSAADSCGSSPLKFFWVKNIMLSGLREVEDAEFEGFAEALFQQTRCGFGQSVRE